MIEKTLPEVPKKEKIKGLNMDSCCARCLWLVPDPDGLGLRCAAYPLGNIPNKFISGKKIHTKVQPGQSGDFVFTPETEYMIK